MPGAESAYPEPSTKKEGGGDSHYICAADNGHPHPQTTSRGGEEGGGGYSHYVCGASQSSGNGRGLGLRGGGGGADAPALSPELLYLVVLRLVAPQKVAAVATWGSPSHAKVGRRGV